MAEDGGETVVAKVLIHWGSGNNLRLSYLQCSPAPLLPNSPIIPQEKKKGCEEEDGGKVVEVQLGTPQQQQQQQQQRLIAYGSLPAFTLLHTQKHMLNVGHSQSTWWENVLEYSRNISALLGSDRVFATGASLSKSSKEDHDLITCKAIWDLLEIFYVDKHAQSWLPERLIEWLENYDRVLSKTTAFQIVAELEQKILNIQFPEDDKGYWDGIASALAVGWLDIAVTMLRMHGSYQHDQIDDRQTENGLVEAVAVLISKMPLLRPNLAPNKLGNACNSRPDFMKALERWRSQVARLNASAFWLECNHQETLSGLKQLLQLLLGDVEILISSTYHWMELLAAHLLFARPFTVVSEGMLGLARKCIQQKAVSHDDMLVELILAVIGLNTEVVLAECAHIFDPWMLTHMTELLTANHTHSQNLLSEEKHILGGVNLEELQRLIYAQTLASHHLTWQVAPAYLACCPRQGLGLLESLLFRLPVSCQNRLPFKVLEICRLYDLEAVSEMIMIIIGIHNWKHGRKGAGISWLQRAHDNIRLSAIANEVLEFVTLDKDDHSNKRQWEELIDALGSDVGGSIGLSFLHRFRDFRMLLNNFQEMQTKNTSKQKLAIAARNAVDCLIGLFKGGAPQHFWLPLLCDSVEFLKYPDDVLLTVSETNMLLAKLQELSIAKVRGDINPFPKHSYHIDRLRLSLAQNLSRAMLKE